MSLLPPPSEPRKRRGRPPKAKAPERDPHVAAAIGYAEDVAGGKILASTWTVKACQRFLRDLGQPASWPYALDEGKAGRSCRFVENLPHVAGPLFGQNLKLEPWQSFVQCNIWGWVKRTDGLRRFRRAQVWVPRGNGKSFFASGSALYGLAADGEGGAQVTSAATTRDQARIVLDTSRRMMQTAEKLRVKLGVEVSQHAIFQQASNSNFRALSSDAQTLDGLNLHLAVLDELHAHPTREVFDVITTGLGKRAQPLLLVISTAGSDQSGIGYEQYLLCRKILDGVIEDDRTFVALWEADEGDDPWAEATWRKANPNLGVSVDIDHIAQEAATARKLASAQSAFLTKHLNVWVNANKAFFNMADWSRCMEESLRREDFAGQPVIVGLDIGVRHDFTAKVLLFHRMIEDKRHYYAFLDSYMSDEEVNGGANASFKGWALDGWIKTNPGNEVDLNRVKDEIRQDAKMYDVREVAHDPREMYQMAQELNGEGIPMVEVRAGVATFSAPMKELEAAHASGRLHVEPNPLFAWMASNVVAHRNAKDEVYPRKEQAALKIDGIVAMLMAVNRALNDVGVQSYTAQHGLLFL